MGDQVGKEIRRAAIEQLVFLAAHQAFNRAFELELKVLERRHLRELVPLLFQQMVRLLQDNVGRKRTGELFDQRRLPGPVGS